MYHWRYFVACHLSYSFPPVTKILIKDLIYSKIFNSVWTITLPPGPFLYDLNFQYQDMIKLREWIPHIHLTPEEMSLSYFFWHATQFFRKCYSRVAWLFSRRMSHDVSFCYKVKENLPRCGDASKEVKQLWLSYLHLILLLYNNKDKKSKQTCIKIIEKVQALLN